MFSKKELQDPMTRIFVIILCISVLAPVILIIETIVLGYPFHHNLKWMLTLVISLTLFFLYRNPELRKVIHHGYFITMICIILPLSWFYSGLNNHFTLAYVFIILIAISYFYVGRVRILYILMLAIVSLSMLTLEVLKPEWFTVMEYGRLLVDNFIQLPLTIAIGGGMLIAFSNAFHEKNKQLDALTKTDVMTGIYNRRYIYEYLDNLRESQFSTTYIGIVDMDNLKQINDTYGHGCGDKVITYFARYLKDYFGDDAIVGRLGGDEFVVILSGGRSYFTEQMINDFSEIEPYFYYDTKVEVTFCAGFVCRNEAVFVDDCMSIADDRMYRGKRSGKNAVNAC